MEELYDGDLIKIVKYDLFGFPDKVKVRFKGKIYTRQSHDGPHKHIHDWDSMSPPPPDYRYVIIKGKKVIYEGEPVYSSRAGEWTPYGRRDVYGGL